MGNILYKERRLLDVLSLATFKTSQLLITVKEQSNGRCPWDMFIFLMHFLSTQKVYLASYTYRRGLLRCSFYSDGQCEGLKVAGRVTGTDSRAFSFIVFTYLINEPSGSGICGYKMSL